MYQSISKRESFIIHPLEKNLKWGKICSYLASQAIYIGIWLENDSQHGVQLFLKKIFSRPDNDNMVNTNAKKCTKAFSKARMSSYTPSKKYEMGQTLFILQKIIQIVKKLQPVTSKTQNVC